jgi:hypothetical protein
LACNLQLGDGYGQLKPTGAGTAGIDIQHPITLLHRWLVRVSRYNNLKSSRRRIEIQFRQVVEDVDEDIADSKNLGFGDCFCPRTSVVVAAYDGNRRQSPQLL